MSNSKNNVCIINSNSGVNFTPLFFMFRYQIYGFLIEKLRPSATTASASNITNGAVYEPLFIRSVFAKVAINDAKIKLKLMIE